MPDFFEIRPLKWSKEGQDHIARVEYGKYEVWKNATGTIFVLFPGKKQPQAWNTIKGAKEYCQVQHRDHVIKHYLQEAK